MLTISKDMSLDALADYMYPICDADNRVLNRLELVGLRELLRKNKSAYGWHAMNDVQSVDLDRMLKGEL